MKVDAILLVDGLHELLRALVVDEAAVGLGLLAQHLEDRLDLLDVVVGLEHDLLGEQFGQDAPGRPHVDLLVLHLGAQHDLGRALLAGHDVLRELLVVVRTHVAAEAEVADVEDAVAVQ